MQVLHTDVLAIEVANNTKSRSPRGARHWQGGEATIMHLAGVDSVILVLKAELLQGSLVPTEVPKRSLE